MNSTKFEFKAVLYTFYEDQPWSNYVNDEWQRRVNSLYAEVREGK